MTSAIARHCSAALAAALFLLAAPAYADIPSEIHIAPDGSFTASNVYVMQKGGASNLFCRITWNGAFIRVTVLAHDTTVVTKDHGEVATSADIQEGDTLSVTGTLSPSDGALVVNATNIHDSSLQVESKSLAGSITSINLAVPSFVLANKTFGNTAVVLTSTTTIQKGLRTIGTGDLAVGDWILAASGAYDYTSNTLTASSVSVYQTKALFTPRNFQGTLKSVAGTTLPTSIVASVNGTDYTVYLSAGAGVVNRARGAVGLLRFMAGDTVRFYGSIRQTNLSEIDAILLRDLNF